MQLALRKLSLLFLLLAVRAFAGAQTEDIFQAVRQGNLDAVKSLAAKDPALLQSKNEGGDTLLHLAAGAGHLRIVDFLLSRKLEVDAKNGGGQTPLFYAAHQGKTNVVSILIGQGADFKVQDRQGSSPLHFAAGQGRTEVVSLLLEKGASPDLKDKAGRTPLELAIIRGQGEVLRIFAKAGILKPKSELGARALHAIAAAGFRDVVDDFVKDGADIGVKAPDGKTMIHSAAAGGLADLVEKALARGLDVRARDDAGRTALYDAVRRGHTAVVVLLLKKGADPNADIVDGRTLLHVAEDHGDMEIVAALKDQGAEVRPRPEVLLEKYPIEGPRPSALVAFVANEGFRIAAGTKTVLIDALVRNPWNYEDTPASALDQMIRRKPPYERIDLLLFSHAHADHFNAAMAVRVLEAHPETILVGNEAVKTDLAREAKDKFAALEPRVKIFNPAWGTVTEATIGGVPLKIYPVNHADFPQEYQTLAYLMNVEGVTLFHLGDSVPQANRKFFESFGLEKAGIDIAFLDSFFLRDPAGLEILPKFIRPDRIIPMHLTREENATLGPELAKAHPSLVLFRDLLDTRTFRKTNIK